MISYEKGDVIAYVKTNPNSKLIFAHGCNCLNKMGNGIAKQVKKELNFLYVIDGVRYRNANEISPLGEATELLGTISAPVILKGNLYFNWYTQLNITTQRARLQDIESCVEQFNQFLINNQHLDFTLVIPKIGCGLGGLKWEDVEPLFEKVLCPVKVFEL